MSDTPSRSGGGGPRNAEEGATQPPPSHADSPLRRLRRHLPRCAGEDEDGEFPVEGYASLFWARDLAGDTTAPGAFADSLAVAGGRLPMRHAHGAEIGVWDEAREDARGLHVKGRILADTPAGRLASALVRAGALDGLSIGFRTRRARRDGGLRVLSGVELKEVSLVVHPMLPGARLTRPR